ncbi:MAG TPA: hypothetical protein VJ998_10555 [Pseudomonadales bacterium]|nr:hypothetical protein [Pseudomonadales bacterium]
MIESLGKTDEPPIRIADALRQDNSPPISFSFTLPQYWLPDTPDIELYAVCVPESGNVAAVIGSDRQAIERALTTHPVLGRESLDRFADALGLSVIDLCRPMRLDTVRIPKPWGAEVWYTGVEARGVCSVHGTPLPWITALSGAVCHGAASPDLVLLKILDPLPDVVYGDLYFEMHEQKTEVYVVTHIDRSAWPDGKGAIRFGFNPQKLAGFVSLAGFKEAWLDSVNAYRKIRTDIDDAFDRFRAQDGITPDQVVSPDLMEQWKARIDPTLNEQEHRCRETMDAFTATRPLEPGDVVRVPPYTPHALQHGVRVVEFQTPHYERYILSFGQKVLTQDHWDTREALDKIDWNAEFDTQLQILESGEDCVIERVADFDTFEVRRIRLEANGHWQMPLSTYVIAMAIDSQVDTNGTRLLADQACLVPAAATTLELSSADEASCLVLLAIPKSLVRTAAGP